MCTNAEQRKLAAIMFTDMVGYSALSQRDDKLTLELDEKASLMVFMEGSKSSAKRLTNDMRLTLTIDSINVLP